MPIDAPMQQAITLLPETVVSGSGAGPSHVLGPDRSLCKFVIEVVNLTANTTLAVYIETGLAQTGWRIAAALDAEISEAGSYALTAVGCHERIRARYELEGANASATLAVLGTSYQLFCSPDDVRSMSVPGAALSDLDDVLLAEACLAATGEAASYLGVNYDLPLTKWGYGLRMHVANMAAYHALRRRGYSPEADPSVRQAYLDAIEWLKTFAGSDSAITDGTPTVGADAAFFVSDTPRGWQRDH